MLQGDREPTRDGVMQLAEQALAAGQWTCAAGHYRAVLERDPKAPLIWVKYGRTLREAGELAQAEAAFRNAIETDWAAADFHLQLGHVLKMQGKKEDAEASFLRAFALDPSLEAASLELTQLGCPVGQLSDLRAILNTDVVAPADRSPMGTMTGTPKVRFSAGPSRRVHRVNQSKSS
jgi:Tfp pilus assembly protein PilF